MKQMFISITVLISITGCNQKQKDGKDVTNEWNANGKFFEKRVRVNKQILPSASKRIVIQ